MSLLGETIIEIIPLQSLERFSKSFDEMLSVY